MSIIKTEELNRFVDQCIQRQNTSTKSHEINEYLVSVASNVATNLAPSTNDGVLIYLCSLNLLNAAIKIKEYKNSLSYGFIKANAAKLIRAIDRTNDCSISYYYNKEEKCLYFKFGSVVFSFRQVPLTVDILKANLAKPIQWPGIRLQQIAKPLFEHFIELLRDEPTLKLLLDSTIAVKASNDSTQMNEIMNNKSAADLIKEIYPNLPTLPGWYVKLTDLFESLRNTTLFSSDNLTYDGLKSIISNIEWLTLKSDYIDKTTGDILEVIKIMELMEPNPIPDEDKAILAQKILSVIDQSCSVDSDGWYDLVEIAPKLFSNGINYKEYGYLKLSVFLESIFGASLQRRNQGTMVYLKFHHLAKSEKPSQDETVSDMHCDPQNTDTNILRGFNIGDIVEISIYGIIKQGEIKDLNKDFVEMSLNEERIIRIRHEAISSIEALKKMNVSEDVLMAAGSKLRQILGGSPLLKTGNIFTNATITMVENRRVWLTTDDGISAACFKGNIIGYAKEKLVKGQRVYTITPKNEKAFYIILEMSYNELLDAFERLASTKNDKSKDHRKGQILCILTYLRKQIDNPETLTELTELKKQIKHNTSQSLWESNDMLDEAPEDENEYNSENSLSMDNDPSKEVESGENDTSIVGKEESQELFKTEATNIQGPKIVGKIDLDKVGYRRVEKKINDASQPTSTFTIAIDCVEEMLPSMGIVTRKGYKFGWVNSYKLDKEIYVPASEFISYSGIIDAPLEGDEVIFTISQNRQGPVAVCVHKQCSREVMEELIEKSQRYDTKTHNQLEKQLKELESINEGTSGLAYYLAKIGLNPKDSFSPDAVEKLFSEILTPEEYSQAISLLIDEVIRRDSSKSYNLFLRASSYTKTHKLFDASRHLINRALNVFAKEEGKVGYFKGLLKTLDALINRIEITEQSIAESIEISKRVFPLMPSYVRDAILAHKDFNGITVDKETIRTGLFKEGYIAEIREAIKQNPTADLLYLTLMKLELTFHLKEYNPYPDIAKFLVNRAKNILALGDFGRYDEARYLLRLSYKYKSFETGFDDTVGLYLMTLGRYTASDIDSYMRGVRSEYKYDDLLTEAISNDLDNNLDIALLSLSNSNIKGRIAKSYEKLKMSTNTINNLAFAIGEVRELFAQLSTNPTIGYQTFISAIKERPILLGADLEIVNGDLKKLISIVADFNIGQKYTELLNAYLNIMRMADEITTKLISHPTEIGYEILMPSLELLKKDLHDRFKKLESRVNPDLQPTILSIEKIDDYTADIRVEIRNIKNSSRDVLIKSLAVSGEDLSENNKIVIDSKLSAGEEKLINIEISLSDKVNKEQVAEVLLEVEFEDIYHSIDERISKTQSCYRTILLTAETFKEIENKFLQSAGGQELDVNDPMFYGRENILTKITSEILGGKRNQIAIYGQKRSGKSSLLNQIKGRLESQTSVVCEKFSLQSLPDYEGNPERWILSKIAVSLLNAIRKTYIPTVKKSEATQFFQNDSDPFAALGDFIIHLGSIDDLKDKHFVIMIDEFTYLYQLIKDGRMNDDFMRRWKAMIETPGVNLQTIIAGQDTLPHFMNEEYASNSFNTFSKEPLSYLSKEEALQLIKDPIKELIFHNHSEELIYEYTAGSAFFIQIFCKSLIEYLNMKKTRTVAKEEVETIAKNLCSGTDRLEPSTFECLTKEADGSDYYTHENEIVLKAIALQTRAGGHVTIKDIKTEVSEDQLIKVLNNLLTRRVITKENEGYSINVKLFAQWMINN